jgi:hypothetical protein
MHMQFEYIRSKVHCHVSCKRLLLLLHLLLQAEAAAGRV